MGTRRTTNQAYRIEENERNAASMATRRTDPSYRISEQNADTYWRRLTRQTNPNQAYRIEENKRNAAYMATRRTDPSYRILEQNADTNQRRLTRQTNDKDPRKSELLLGYLGLRTVYRITPPTLAHVVDICKWKERDEGRSPWNQKSTAKDKKREPKTKLK
jgi:hypothetical protein